MLTLGYAAGFIDGEGCIAIYKNKGSKDLRYKQGTKSPSWIRGVTVANTYKPVLDELYVQFGGRVRLHKKATGTNKAQWTWSVSSKEEIISFLDQICGYLIEKREQAEVMLLACRDEMPTEEAADSLKRLKRLKYVE